jgi:hypothetical protein
MAINTAMIAMTTSSSINVKPFNLAMMDVLSILEKIFLCQSPV